LQPLQASARSSSSRGQAAGFPMGLYTNGQMRVDGQPKLQQISVFSSVDAMVKSGLAQVYGRAHGQRRPIQQHPAGVHSTTYITNTGGRHTCFTDAATANAASEPGLIHRHVDVRPTGRPLRPGRAASRWPFPRELDVPDADHRYPAYANPIGSSCSIEVMRDTYGFKTRGRADRRRVRHAESARARAAGTYFGPGTTITGVIRP
jgi:hypothetical protein